MATATHLPSMEERHSALFRPSVGTAPCERLRRGSARAILLVSVPRSSQFCGTEQAVMISLQYCGRIQVLQRQAGTLGPAG